MRIATLPVVHTIQPDPIVTVSDLPVYKGALKYGVINTSLKKPVVVAAFALRSRAEAAADLFTDTSDNGYEFDVVDLAN